MLTPYYVIPRLDLRSGRTKGHRVQPARENFSKDKDKAKGRGIERMTAK
jgi:hypothetical protein